MDSRRALLVLGLAFGGLFVMFFLGLILVVGDRGGGPVSGNKARVGVVEVRDTIEDSKDFVEKLRRFVDDDGIKAIVVRVDSPGGSVGPSQEMRSEIVKARQKKKVVASLGAMATSGGYYVAVGADKIVTNPGTLTGSIGVVMQHPLLAELMRSAKVDMQTYKSGALKDSGSPFRAPSPEDKAYLQGVTNAIHAQFVDAVAESRALERSKVAEVADGRVITGAQAVELGLVDELGTLSDAASLALKLAGIEKEAELVYPPKKGGLLAELIDTSVESAVRGLKAELSPSRLLTLLPALPSAEASFSSVK